MSIRTALNITYAMLTDGMDSKEKRKFDDDLHGWTGENERADRALRGGGE